MWSVCWRTHLGWMILFHDYTQMYWEIQIHTYLNEKGQKINVTQIYLNTYYSSQLQEKSKCLLLPFLTNGQSRVFSN